MAPPIITTSDPDFDSDKILPDLLQCIDTGVNYKTPKKDRINNVFQVETASKWSVRLCNLFDGETGLPIFFLRFSAVFCLPLFVVCVFMNLVYLCFVLAVLDAT